MKRYILLLPLIASLFFTSCIVDSAQIDVEDFDMYYSTYTYEEYENNYGYWEYVIHEMNEYDIDINVSNLGYYTAYDVTLEVTYYLSDGYNFSERYHIGDLQSGESEWFYTSLTVKDAVITDYEIESYWSE